MLSLADKHKAEIKTDPKTAADAKTPAEATPALSPELSALIAHSIELCRTGRYDEAKTAMQALIEEHPNCSPAYLIMGTACVGKGNLDTATTLLKRAITLDPTNKEAHYNLCQLLIRAEEPDFDAARTHYRQAAQLGLEPDIDLEAVLNL